MAKFDYSTCLRLSERVSWLIDDVLPDGSHLDFQRRFMPEALTGTGTLDFLAAPERLKLNQIFGNSYLNLFEFVEEYIAADVAQHAIAAQFGDDDAFRALLRFADEEVKHRTLFTRFGRLFAANFGSPCDVLQSAQEVAQVILSKNPLAITLTTLHLELITQQHYTHHVRERTDEEQLDPLFARLLRFHWIEEAQHAKLDVLEIEKMMEFGDEQVVDGAMSDYVGIVGAFDGLLGQQAEMDAGSLERAVGRALNGHRDQVIGAMHQAYRRAFLLMGIEHPQFIDMLDELSPTASQRARALLPGLGAAKGGAS